MSTTAEFIIVTGLIIFSLSVFAIASSFNNPSFSLSLFFVTSLSFYLFLPGFSFFSSQPSLFFSPSFLNNYHFYLSKISWLVFSFFPSILYISLRDSSFSSRFCLVTFSSFLFFYLLILLLNLFLFSFLTLSITLTSFSS